MWEELQKCITDAKRGWELLESAVSIAVTEKYMKEANAHVTNEDLSSQLVDHVAKLENVESEKAKPDLWRAQLLEELGIDPSAMQEGSASARHVHQTTLTTFGKRFDKSLSIVKVVWQTVVRLASWGVLFVFLSF